MSLLCKDFQCASVFWPPPSWAPPCSGPARRCRGSSLNSRLLISLPRDSQPQASLGQAQSVADSAHRDSVGLVSAGLAEVLAEVRAGAGREGRCVKN